MRYMVLYSRLLAAGERAYFTVEMSKEDLVAILLSDSIYAYIVLSATLVTKE